MRVLLIAPTALDFQGRPIKKRRLYLPALTLPALGACTPREVDLRIVHETVEDIPYDEPWDLVGLTGMGSGIVRAWQIGDEFRERGIPVDPTTWRELEEAAESLGLAAAELRALAGLQSE